MLQLALPLYKQMFPGQPDYSNLPAEERENKIIGAVLNKISDEHPQRDQLIEAVKADLDGIKQFIREKKIVSLSSRDNLKVIPTPEFERGIYSVAGFHGAPPLEPAAEAQYWVTPIDPKMSEAKAESKLREYNNYALKWLTIHEALPGHYVQFEHADDVEPPTRRVLRNLFGNGAYVEGWAEYGADVMTQEGYLDFNPKFKLVRLKIWLRATANTILDIRLQTMNMTDQQALDLMTKECFQTQAEADGKLVRAKLSSTQLPDVFRRHSPVVVLAQEISGREGQQLHVGRVPQPRARPGAVAHRVSGENHFAGKWGRELAESACSNGKCEEVLSVRYRRAAEELFGPLSVYTSNPNPRWAPQPNTYASRRPPFISLLSALRHQLLPISLRITSRVKTFSPPWIKD